MNLKAVSSLLLAKREHKPASWNVILRDLRNEFEKRDAVEKIVQLFPVSYEEAHELVDRTPIILLEGMTRQEAEAVQRFFGQSGIDTLVTQDELLKRKCYRTVWPEKPRLDTLFGARRDGDPAHPASGLSEKFPVHDLSGELGTEEESHARPFESGLRDPAQPLALEADEREREALLAQLAQLKQEVASLRLLRDIAKAPLHASSEEERDGRRLAERFDAASREKEILKARLAALEQELRSERGATRRLGEEERRLSGEVARLVAELARTGDERASAGELARRVEELERARQTLEANCEGLLSERAQSAKQVEDLQAELRLASHGAAREVEALREQVKNLTSQNELFMNSLRDKEAVEERCRMMARDLEAAQRQVRDLTVYRDREEAVQKRSKLQTELAEKESRLRELVRKQEALEQEVMEREKLMKEILHEQEEIEKDVVRAKQAQKYLTEQSKWRDKLRPGGKRPSGVQIESPGEAQAGTEDIAPGAVP